MLGAPLDHVMVHVIVNLDGSGDSLCDMPNMKEEQRIAIGAACVNLEGSNIGNIMRRGRDEERQENASRMLSCSKLALIAKYPDGMPLSNLRGYVLTTCGAKHSVRAPLSSSKLHQEDFLRVLQRQAGKVKTNNITKLAICWRQNHLDIGRDSIQG